MEAKESKNKITSPSKLDKCPEPEVITIFDVHSDSDTEQILVSATNKLAKKKSSKQRSTRNEFLDISSDSENLFSNTRQALLQRHALQKENASLRIKLRRSTEQSLYKIDTDSECEKPVHKTHKRLLRPRKKSCSDVESEGSYTDGKDNSIKSNGSSNKKIVQEQVPNNTPRQSRIRRPPLRFSSYQCDAFSVSQHSENVPKNAPSLRNRRNVNYNEDKLFVESIASNMRMKLRSVAQKENENGNNSDSKQKVKMKQVHSNKNNNKRNRVPSIKDSENDSSTDTAITKTKALRTSSEPDINLDSPKIGAAKKQELPPSIESTPVKSNKQKRVISIQQTNNEKSDTDEEHLTDMYKRIKISSATKNVTPAGRNMTRRTISQNRRTNVQSDDNDNSDIDEQDLADMCKSIKISSARRNIAQTPQKRSNIQKGVEVCVVDEAHLSTPKSRSIKHNNLTPSLGKRNSALLKPSTPLQEARSRLHVSAVPKSLPCREEEFNNIFTFLKGKLEDKSGGCIYISGVPGTGKTATVNEAVRCLQKLIVKGQLDDFNYIAINGMKLTEPRQAYVQILKQLDGKTATWEQAYRILERRFHSKASRMTLLLVDELDFLCTRRQDVVYNLLDWPTKSTAQLVVITIANTMDLPERILMGRVTSRLGLTRLTFQPYNYKQLQEIVMSRLKDFNGFRNEAVQLVARKVSAVSGDARRALDICRRAMEIGESRNAETISLQDVTEAVSEMIASAKVQAIKHCSKMEKVFLQAVAAEVTRTSIEEVYFKDAYRQLESLCSFEGIEVPTVTEILAICGRLGANRLLICEHSRNDIHQKILLNVSTDDIHYATQELDLSS